GADAAEEPESAERTDSAEEPEVVESATDNEGPEEAESADPSEVIEHEGGTFVLAEDADEEAADLPEGGWVWVQRYELDDPDVLTGRIKAEGFSEMGPSYDTPAIHLAMHDQAKAPVVESDHEPVP